MIPRINEVICTGCKSCIEVCPPRSIYIEEEKAYIDQEFCEECGFCAAECPAGAITIDFPASSGR
ncbi:MAG: ferredoxin [Syntrophorhabdus sp. PtaU1.Bin058]|nr:MAG: ferredoxin [Syntrophorhabdus sp. PtaU1.Bin058]